MTSILYSREPHPVFEPRKSFASQDVDDIIYFLTEDSRTKGALHRRLQHLCLNQTEVVYRKKMVMAGNLNQAFRTFHYRFLKAMEMWRTGFNFVFFTFVWKRIRNVEKKEIPLEEFHGIRETEDPDYVDVRVPIALEYGEAKNAVMIKNGHEILVKYEKKGAPLAQHPHSENGGTSKKDEDIIYVIQFEPPCWETGKFTSELATLLRNMREIDEERVIFRQVGLQTALPPHVFERVNPTDLQNMTEMHAIEAEQQNNILVVNGKFVEKTPEAIAATGGGEGGAKMSSQLDILSSNLLNHKKLVDPMDTAIYVRPGFKATTNFTPAVYTGDFFRLIENYENQIALVLLVPLNYLRPVHTGNDSKSAAGEHDLSTLKEHCCLIARMLEEAEIEMWSLLYQRDNCHELSVYIRVSSNIHVDHMINMVNEGLLDGHVAKPLAYQKHYIPMDTMLPYKKPETTTNGGASRAKAPVAKKKKKKPKPKEKKRKRDTTTEGEKKKDVKRTKEATPEEEEDAHGNKMMEKTKKKSKNRSRKDSDASSSTSSSSEESTKEKHQKHKKKKKKKQLSDSDSSSESSDSEKEHRSKKKKKKTV
jgi:hypothetical protein